MLSLAAVPRAPASDPVTVSVPALEKQLEHAQGKERVDLLLKLADTVGDDDFERARAVAEEARVLAVATADRRAEATALYHVGKALSMLGRAEEAMQPLTRALELARAEKDEKGAAQIVNAFGIAEYRRGRFAEAGEHFLAALAFWEKVGDDRNQATALSNLGSVRCQQGKLREGGEFFERALAMQRKLGNVEGEALALNNLGIVRQHTADYAGAIDAFLGALALEEGRGNRPGISRASGNVGAVYKNLGQLDKAVEYISRALALDREIGDRHSLITSLNNLGGIHADRGDHEKAVPYYLEGLAIAREMNNPAQMVSLLVNLGDAYEHTGRMADSLGHYRQALGLAEQAGMEAEVVAPLLSVARVLRREGDGAGSRRLLERALRAAEASEDKELLRDVHQAQAEDFAASHDYRRAYEAHLRYVAEHDGILNADANARIAEMEARFASEKKAREIELLKRDNEIQRLRLRTESMRVWALLAGLGIVVLVAGLLLRRYRHLLAFWRSRSHIGAYRILDQIGSGGMGVVYKAVHVRDRSRPVAIKVLREDLSQDPILRQRLRNEAALIDQIDHPNIVRVFERGESDHKLYIVMEWLDGQTLAQRVRSGEPLPLEACLALMRQLADAVARIHARGIVHRDLKPENVMLVNEGDRLAAKLLDFDIAKAGSHTRLTETGVIVGTVGYLAPERITRQVTCPESDTFALGVVFYEALTLEKPFFGENAAEVVRHILEGQPLDPRTLRPELPAGISALVLEMLAKEPAARPSDGRLLERLAAADLPRDS